MRPNNTDEATVHRIGFCWCKVLLPHDLAEGNQRIRIREKSLQFSSAVLSTLSPYLVRRNKNSEKLIYCAVEPITYLQSHCVVANSQENR